LAFGFDAGAPEPTPTLAPPTPTPGEPTATPTFVYTLTPSPTPTLEPGVTPSPTATPSPTPSGTLTPTPTSPPLPTPEPLTEDEFTTRFDEFLQDMNAATGLSKERLRELWLDTFRTVRLRKLVMEELGITADETKELVRAAHILVLTEEEAQAALERINAGEEFEVVAAEISRDVSNAYRGGDLGWFGRGAMVEPFEEAAFTLSPGEISQPVETSFGWHLIKLYERDDDAIVTPAEQNQQMQTLFAEMLSEWRNEVDVVIADNWLDHVPTLP
jgi:peptidyl-prolyl cis-trans isomerase D